MKSWTHPRHARVNWWDTRGHGGPLAAARISKFSYKMDPSCGNDSSSSGVISDQSSSNCGIAPPRSQRSNCHEPRSGSSISSYSSSSRRPSVSSSTACLPTDANCFPVAPSPSASVHWGETRVHTYEREDTTDNEEQSIVSVASSSSSSMLCSPCLEEIVEIDVDKIMVMEPPSGLVVLSCDPTTAVSMDEEKRAEETQPAPTTTAQQQQQQVQLQAPPQQQQYVETNLDATDIQCPACVFDCGPIHPYIKNSMLQPHQCIHDEPGGPPSQESGQEGAAGAHLQSSSSLSSSDSSYAYLPGALCGAHPHLHQHQLHHQRLQQQQQQQHNQGRCCRVSSSSEGLSSVASFAACRTRAIRHSNSASSLNSGCVSVAENNSPFACISQPLLVRILSHLETPDLCRTARVCKRWYRAAWSPSLWTAVSMTTTTAGEQQQIDADKGLRAVTKILSYATYPVCSILQRVDIHNSSSLTDRGVYTMAKRCPEMRSVDIRGCPHVTNLAIFELVSRCLNLEVLIASGCEQVSCVSLTPEAARQSPSPTGHRVFLRQLDLSGCPRLDDPSLSLVASHCTELSHLYLRRCARLTDLGLQYVARYCAQLREVSLNECPRLTDLTLSALAGRLGPQLRYLSVAKCSLLSDPGVAALAARCPRLRYLNLRGCSRVSDTSVEALARACPRLRSLDLGGCDISDDSLLALGANCAQLRRLNLRGCDAVTDGGVADLARGCRALLLLNLHECSVTAGAYEAVRRHCPACIIEHNSPGAFL